MTELVTLTEQLKETLLTSLSRYEDCRKTKKVYDFYTEVKPLGDEVFQLTGEWKEKVFLWVQKNRPRNIHPPQIENVVEQINELVVQSFYYQTSYKRFKSTHQSALFTVDLVLSHLKENIHQ